VALSDAVYLLTIVGGRLRAGTFLDELRGSS
jgi:hypothetical protein